MKDSTNTKKLLQYWGSDYRTHTTLKKWENALIFLQNKQTNILEPTVENDTKIQEKNNKLIFELKGYKLIFNLNKGLALENIYNNLKKLPFGTVKHGELDYITLGADFYTSSSTIESTNTKKITDLNKVQSYTFNKIGKNCYKISTILNLKDKAIEHKEWIIDLETKKLTLQIKLETSEFINGSIRLGTFTLLPQNKNSNFWYECKNGGKDYERHYINDTKEIEHSKSNSILQSSRGGIGATDGILRFGIQEDVICEINIDRQVSYPFVMLQNSHDHDKYLTRVFFSVQEIDDTLKYSDNKEFHLKYSLNID